MYFKTIIISLFSLLIPTQIFSCDDRSISIDDLALVNKIFLLQTLPEAEQMDNGFGVSYDHSFVSPEFIERIFSSSSPLKVLEIGPGDGRVLKKLLSDPRNGDHSFVYHFVDPSALAQKSIESIKKKYNSNPNNIIAKAADRHKGDVRSFLDGKLDVYDLILCNNVLHYFTPVEQLKIMGLIQQSVKQGGEIFLSQSSIASGDIWGIGLSPDKMKVILLEQFSANQANNDLWPGFIIEGMASVHISMNYEYTKRYSPIPMGWSYPTLHSPATFRDLLETYGFEVETCVNFTEIVDNNGEGTYKAVSVRVGAIAKKARPINKDRFDLYSQRAQKKGVICKGVQKVTEMACLAGGN